MRLNGRKTVIASVLLSCVLVFVAEQVLAQNPRIKGKGKLSSIINQKGSITAGNGIMVDADELDEGSILVPEKMTMVITDLIVSNAAVADGTFFVTRSQVDAVALTHSIVVPAGTTFSYNFGTGLEFGPGAGANIFAGAGANLSYTVRGYLRKG